MRASTQTNLSLFEWFQIVGMHPYFAAQVGLNVPQSTSPQCDDVIYQFGWQHSDNIGREDIARAIAEAEDMIADHLGYFTAPRYVLNDRQPYPQTYDKRALTGMTQPDGHLKSLQVAYRQIQAIGIEALTAINAAAAVAYSDTTSDGILDTFTITQAVAAGVTADEIAVFFTSTDRNGLPQNEFEIRPISVSISAGTATITGHRALMVLPDPTLIQAPVSLDVTDVGNFVTTVEVYRRTTDPSDAGTLIWENLHPSIYWEWMRTNCVPPCQVEITTGCFGTRDMALGYVYPRPAQYDADTAAFTALCAPQHRSPDRVTVNYLAGYPRDSKRLVERRLARATALLAASMLPRKKCGCDSVQQYLWELRNLPTDAGGNLEVAQPDIEKASRMFGSTKRGAVEAAKLIQKDEAWGAVRF